MWSMEEPCPRSPRGAAGHGTLYPRVSVVVWILLICVQRTNTTCHYPAAETCYFAALSKSQTASCQSSQIIPDLQTCLNPTIDTCTTDVIEHWTMKVSSLESSLNNIVAKSNLNCNTACLEEVTETAAVAACTVDYTNTLVRIQTGGSNGENVSASCKKAQTAVTCLNNAGSCPKTVASRTTLIAQYDAVKQYCVTTPATASTDTEPLSDKPNQTVLIIIGCLILVIIIVNVIIAIVYVYHRRQREMKKATTPRRLPMASRISYYQ